jgi:hypothetical protein
MGDLFARVRRQAEANARQAVSLYSREVSEYRLIGSGSRPAMLDFAVFIRRRSADRAEADHPLAEEDLAAVADSGRRRGEQLLSLPSQQQVLGLHTRLMLREIHEAAGPRDLDTLLRFVAWFGAQGIRARTAYLEGYAAGVTLSRSPTGRLELLTRMLVTDEPVDGLLAGRLGVTLAPRYLVCVLRFPGDPVLSREAREETLAALATDDRTATAWLAPGELVFLLPDSGEDEAAAGRAAARARRAATVAARPCSAGAARGRAGALADALESARRICGVAPPETMPQRLYAVDDLFVELGVAATPWLDDWLREYSVRLRSGPDLLRTLDTYYRHDMSRLGAASALHVHPRTLDYRLQRVRELTGLDPGSTRGVRILSAAVTRTLAAGGG